MTTIRSLALAAAGVLAAFYLAGIAASTGLGLWWQAGAGLVAYAATIGALAALTGLEPYETVTDATSTLIRLAQTLLGLLAIATVTALTELAAHLPDGRPAAEDEAPAPATPITLAKTA